MERLVGRDDTPELMNVSPLSTGGPRDGGQFYPMTMVDDLLRNDWLLSRRAQLQAQLDLYKAGASNDIDQLSAENRKERCRRLKDELLEDTVVLDCQQLLLWGEQLAETGRAVLNIDEARCWDLTVVHWRRLLEERLAEFTDVSSEVGKQHKELTMLRTELDDLKKNNFDLFKRSRQQYQELSRKKKSKEDELRTLTTDPKGKRLQDKLQTKLHRNLIQCNVVQGLVYGSGVNWVQQPRLQKLLLEAGKPLHL